CRLAIGLLRLITTVYSLRRVSGCWEQWRGPDLAPSEATRPARAWWPAKASHARCVPATRRGAAVPPPDDQSAAPPRLRTWPDARWRRRPTQTHPLPRAADPVRASPWRCAGRTPRRGRARAWRWCGQWWRRRRCGLAADGGVPFRRG